MSAATPLPPSAPVSVSAASPGGGSLRVRYRMWEVLAIASSGLLFAAGLYGYVVDLGLRRFLFGLKDEEGQVTVGKILPQRGVIKRQLQTEGEFKPLGEASAAFNQDTLVTGNDSSARIELNDGGVLELGPNTMIQLAFETQYGMGGIQRAAIANVIKGKVSGQSAGARQVILRAKEKTVAVTRVQAQSVTIVPPTVAIPAPEPIVEAAPVPLVTATPVAVAPTVAPLPTVSASPSVSPTPLVEVSPSASPSVAVVPNPIAAPSLAVPPIVVPTPVASAPAPEVTTPPPVTEKIELLSPASNVVLKVDPKSGKLEKRVEFRWRISPARESVKLRVFRNSETAPVLDKLIPLKKVQGALDWTARKPGNYTWELASAEGAALAPQRGFKVDPAVRSIQVLDPLVAGKLGQSNQFQGELIQDFSLTLRWKPQPKVASYHVWFGKAADDEKALLERDVTEAELTFNRNNLFSGTLFYRVSASVDGWELTSQTEKFQFSFLPPLMVMPQDKAEIKPSVPGRPASMLFTWQKTNFTEGYEFQIASDAQFKNITQQKTLKDNLFVLPAIEPGHYYWRVRAFSKKLSSSFGKPNEFTVVP